MSSSPLVGNTCSRCQGLFTMADEVLVCNSCGKKFHAMCWGIGERCTTSGCTGTPARQAQVLPQMPSMPPPPPMMAQPQIASGFANSLIQMEDERTLIVRDGTNFPPICIMTGKNKDLVKRKRNESWAPAWTGIFIVLSLLIYVIVRLIMQKKATIEIYLDREYAQARMWRSIGNTALFFTLFIAGVINFANENEALGMVLIIACIVVPIIVFVTTIQLYSVVKIEDGNMKIKFRKPEQARAIYNAAMNR